jgi:hypothetical protein
MARVEFEPTIPAFERAKTVHAPDRAATAIGKNGSTRCRILVSRIEIMFQKVKSIYILSFSMSLFKIVLFR